MGANTRYCMYNCDYMCSMCLQAERDAEKNGIPKIPGPINPLVDNGDTAAPGWMGYHDRPDLVVDDYGELSGFPLQKYDMVGNLLPHGTHGTTSYVPPPLRILKEKQVVLVNAEVMIDSPPLLTKGEIIT